MLRHLFQGRHTSHWSRAGQERLLSGDNEPAEQEHTEWGQETGRTRIPAPSRPGGYTATGFLGDIPMCPYRKTILLVLAWRALFLTTNHPQTRTMSSTGPWIPTRFLGNIRHTTGSVFMVIECNLGLTGALHSDGEAPSARLPGPDAELRWDRETSGQRLSPGTGFHLLPAFSSFSNPKQSPSKGPADVC